MVVAHEMGHALGLEHVNVDGNLMMPRLPIGRCTLGLDDEQVGTLRTTSLVTPFAEESWRVLAALHGRLVTRAIARNDVRR